MDHFVSLAVNNIDTPIKVTVTKLEVKKDDKDDFNKSLGEDDTNHTNEANDGENEGGIQTYHTTNYSGGAAKIGEEGKRRTRRKKGMREGCGARMDGCQGGQDQVSGGGAVREGYRGGET